MPTTSTINPIDFDGFRAAFIEYVRGKTEFSDIDYQSSGVAQLMNILAYNATYLGYYLEANDNEHYLDTAQTKSSVYAHAKRYGYVVKGKRASKAEVTFECILDELPENRVVHISRNWNIVGKNRISDVTRNFLLEKDVYLSDYERLQDGTFRFFSPIGKTHTLFQGERRTWDFLASSDKEKRYVIKDDGIDIDTINIFVKNTTSPNEVGEEYLLASNMVMSYDEKSPVFTVATAESEWYEIFFGKNLIGKEPSPGQFIHCEYIAPSGEDGDGCTEFTLTGFNVIVKNPSFGGSDGESIESIKNNAPNHFRRQNRIFTEGDVKGILLEEFRNIKSINVWGGEENNPKYYGKTMVAIKPNNSETLSQGAKLDIKKRLLNIYGYAGMDVQLVDPEYIDVDIVYNVELKDTVGDVTKANVEQAVKDTVHKYSEKNLNQFGKYLNDTELNSLIVNSSPAIDSVYSSKRICKTFSVNTNNNSPTLVNLSNPVEPNTVMSVFKDYNYTWTMKDDGNGKLVATAKNEHNETLTTNVGKVDYQKGTYEFITPLYSKRNHLYEVEISAKPQSPNG